MKFYLTKISQVVSLIITTALLGLLPECSLKMWLNRKLYITSFRIISRAASSIINIHNPEHRPKNGAVCVANHTSPADVAMLSVDNCYSLVSSNPIMGQDMRSRLKMRRDLLALVLSFYAGLQFVNCTNYLMKYFENMGFTQIKCKQIIVLHILIDENYFYYIIHRQKSHPSPMKISWYFDGLAFFKMLGIITKNIFD